MALLGNLTVGILGDLSGYSDGLSKAQRETVKFSKKIEQTGRNISTIGYGFQDLGSNLTNKITKPALVAGGALAGMVGTLGFKRLVGMDNAQAKLQGLGYEGKSVEEIMQDVEVAVQGTTHTMAEGVDTAAGALAAGVEQGKELERYVKLVGDAAVGSNRPMGEMAQIFNRVQGSGKLMTQELNMIEMGMPGFAQAMADNLADGSLEAFREMVTNGEVGSEEFLNVMEGFAGGMSEAYAGTWSGMTKNVLANIGIIGEALLDGVFQDGKQAIADFLDVLRSDGLREWAAETGEKIREFAETVVEKVTEMKARWDELSPSVQDLIKKIALFGSIGLVAIGPVLLVFGKFIVSIGNLVTRFGAIMGAVTKLGGLFGVLTGPIGIVIGIIAALIGIGVLLWKNWDTIKEKAQTVFSAFSPLLERVKDSFMNLKNYVSPIMDSLKNLWQSLLPLLQKLGMIIGAVVVPAFGILVSVFSAVMSALGPFINAIINLVDVIVNIVNAIVALFMGDFSGALEFWEKATESTIEFVKNLWETVKQFFVTFVETIIEFFKGLYDTLVGNSIIPDMVNAIVDWFKNMYKWLIELVENIADGIVTFFTKIYDRAVTIFEALFSIVKEIWRYIKNTFQNALNFLLALVTGDFEGMKKAMEKQMKNAQKLLSKVWEGIQKIIGDKASQILKNIINKFIDIKNNMQNKINEAKTAVINKFTEIVTGVGRKVNEVYTKVRNKFNDAKNAMLKPIESARDKIKGIIDKIKGFFTGLKLSIPKITMPKLPRFSLTGKFSLVPPQVPKLDVNWYKDGGIFAANNPQLIGIGDAKVPEAALPLSDSVLSVIGNAIANTMRVNDENRVIELHITNVTELDGAEVARRTYRYTTEYQERDKQIKNSFRR